MKLNTKDKGKSGIYIIKNLVNNKVYIGKSKNIYFRIKQHITHLNTKSKDENRHLINSWHKHGRKNFEYSVIEYLEFDENVLKERELFWMEFYNSLNRKKGYNLRKDAKTNCEVTKETREKCRISQIKRFEDDNERKKIGESTKKFWKENPDIKEQMREKIKNANRLYRIGKYSKNTDELIEIFEFKDNIKEKYPDFYIQAILGCCQGTKKSYKGFNWHYVELNTNNRAK